MKRIVCELCEGTVFTKENGMFVCHGCGTRYTTEEARGMMQEFEGDAPVVGATVVGVPGGNPNQAQIDNILLLASNAYSASNNEETEKYCNRAIELDATCYKAWMLKGKAVGWQSTVQKPRIAEAAHSFKQAVDFAPEDEKESLSEEAAEELKRLGLACISLRQKRFSQYPDSEELNGFLSDIEHLIEGLAVLLSKGAEVAQAGALEGLLGKLANLPTLKIITLKSKAEKAGAPKELFSQMAIMMNNAAIDGFNTAKKKYDGDNHPLQNDLAKTIREVDNCITLLGLAISFSDDDDEDDIKRYESKNVMEEYLIHASAYDSYSSTWRSISLTDEAKKNRRNNIQSNRNSIKEIKDKIKEKEAEEQKKAEEEKRARIAAYWETHAEEKAALDSEKAKLETQSNELASKISNLYSEIQSLNPSEAVPSEEEDNRIKEQIRILEKQRSELGMFAGKQKKQITEEIATLNGRRDSLKSKIEGEKEARRVEFEAKSAPLQAKKDELSAELSKATKRIAAIEAELTKDPEA